MTLIIALLACNRIDDPDETTTAPGSTDEIVTAGADPEILDLQKVTNERISTAFRVSWSTEAVSEGWVEYGPTAAYGVRTSHSPSPGTRHAFVVAGLPADSTWHWRAVSEIDGVQVVSADQVHTVEPPPTDLPAVELTAREETLARAGGFRALTLIDDGGGVAVVNDAGELVWWQQQVYPETITQVRFAPDGSGLWYLIGDASRKSDIGEVRFQSWDGEVRAARAEQAHHDFDLLPDGRIAFLTLDVREFEGESVVGDAIVVMDADGGNPIPVWSTWDHLGDPELTTCDTGFYSELGCDWSHGNSLNYDPSDHSLLASFHALGIVSKVMLDEADGPATTAWEVGRSTLSDFSISPGSAIFDKQHAFRAVGDGDYVVFDNGQGAVSDYSEVWRYHLDEGSGSLEAVWGFDYDRRRNSIMLGDIHLLDNGNYLTAWGSEGEVAEIDPAGSVVWEAYADLGTIMGFIDFAATVGGPVDPD